MLSIIAVLAGMSLTGMLGVEETQSAMLLGFNTALCSLFFYRKYND